MGVPTTIMAALNDRLVRGAACLEAGTGVDNATAGLLNADTEQVYAVTNDPGHATIVHDRVAPSPTSRTRTTVLETNVRNLPLADDSVDVVIAHGLLNFVSPTSVAAAARELTRVATSGCYLIIDGYGPLPDDTAVRGLFAPENAADQLAHGRPALTFYPADMFGTLFSGYGWRFDRELTLLDPVLWSASHVETHASVTTSFVAGVPDPVGGWFADEAERVADAVKSESTGEMYSVAMWLSDSMAAGTPE